MAQKRRHSNTDGKKRRVLIVDDHPIVRDGLGTLIDHERDLEMCGEADDAQDALRVIAELRPDVAIVDLTLKNSDGLELTKSIKAQYSGLPVIILSIHDESVYAERALRAGAQAYLMKEVASENIIKAIRTVLAGEVYVSDEIAKKFLRKAAGGKAEQAGTPTEILSDREFEIFNLIGEGYKTSQIARRMHLSVKTVETYRGRIKGKLDGSGRRFGAAQVCHQMGRQQRQGIIAAWLSLSMWFYGWPCRS
ncbi:MAG: response regulator transcription factor [Planctomycetota bacterium]|jgi:DNA-binding NarL/FixJ family response regulator